jgi:DNA helicase-2/ATP-dependent DNA helicase PcrA
MELNEEQKEAVEHGEGPLLIIAGAGTGKTTVITQRVAHLISSKKAKPEEILALTFTEKAALEMEERVDILLPYGYADVWISTFHSFGDRVLREHALELGLTPDFRVLSQPEQAIFFKEHLFDFPLSYYRPLGNPTKHIEAILRVISRAKDEDISPEEYLAYAKDLMGDATLKGDKQLTEIATKQLEIAKTYKTYQDLMTREGFVDFGDQVNLTLNLFREHPSVLKEYRVRFRYILVDEFQDTNYAQFQLVSILSEGHRNITVVGDDDQSIYKFRGAAISNILNFMKYYPDGKQVVLTRNYRSGKILLNSAYRLIQHNNPDRLEVKNRIDKRLTAFDEGIPITFLQCDTVSGEADTIAKLIEEKVASGYRYKDLAILVRANNDADPFLRSLNMKGVPFRFTGNRGLYTRPEVKLLIAFLKTLSRFGDSVSLYHLASSELYGLKGSDLVLCMNRASRGNQTLHYIFFCLSDPELVSEPGLEDITAEGKATIQKLMEDIWKYVELSKDIPTGQLLYTFLTESGYLARLSHEGIPQSDEKVQNIARFFEIVKNFGYITTLDRVPQFVDHLDLMIDAGDDPPAAEADLDSDAVQVMTVHKAKGLEFPVVFMIGLVERKFPTDKRTDPIEIPEPLIKDILPAGNFHLQEERRLFYVGMTRTQKELYLSCAMDYGGQRARKLSRFVREALDLPDIKEKLIKTSPLETLKGFAPHGEESVSMPVPEDGIISLSHYHIDDYITCPLKYKYVHVLRVPILHHHTVIYGAAIHEAIKEYHRRKVADRPVTEDDLIKVFEGAWRREGFLTREHEEKRFEAGKEALRKFFRDEKEKDPPTHIEKDFSFLLDKNLVRGRWDRVDIRDGEVVIIDYKTSEVHKEEDAHRKAKESLQLSIYALAYRERFGNVPDRLELRFIESGLVGVTVKKEKDLIKTEELIKEVSESIRKRDFTARPVYMACGYCAYQGICPK